MNKLAFVIATVLLSLTVGIKAAEKTTDRPDVPPPLTFDQFPKELNSKQTSACQMVLCLSSPIGLSTSECTKPLRDYWKMSSKKRHRHLKLCPR